MVSPVEIRMKSFLSNPFESKSLMASPNERQSSFPIAVMDISLLKRNKHRSGLIILQTGKISVAKFMWLKISGKFLYNLQLDLLVCEMHFWVSCFFYSLENCLPFLQGVLLSWGNNVKKTKTCLYFKLCSFLTMWLFANGSNVIANSNPIKVCVLHQHFIGLLKSLKSFSRKFTFSKKLLMFI